METTDDDTLDREQDSSEETSKKVQSGPESNQQRQPPPSLYSRELPESVIIEIIRAFGERGNLDEGDISGLERYFKRHKPSADISSTDFVRDFVRKHGDFVEKDISELERYLMQHRSEGPDLDKRAAR